MALSASTDFNANRDNIIYASLRICNAIESGEPLPGEEMNDAVLALNMMLKSWQADGLQLFARRRITVLLEKNKSKYTLSTSGDYAAYSEDVRTTTVKVAAILSDVTIDVVDTTGMVAGDYIAFELDNGDLHKTTIVTVVDSDTVTVALGVTDTIAIGKKVWWFTNKVARPQRVLQSFTRDSASLDTIITLVSQQEYWALSKKATSGRVNQVYYDPQIAAGYLYVWPETDLVTSTLELIIQKPFDDMDVSTNNVEYPTEWLNAIKFNLALMLSYEYGLIGTMIDRIEKRAFVEKALVMSYDQEPNSLFFQPSQS